MLISAYTINSFRTACKAGIVEDSSHPNTAQVTTSHRSAFREFDFHGLRLHSVTSQSLLGYVDVVLRDKTPCVLFGYSLTVIPRLKDEPEIATLGNSFDILLPEGKGIFMLANLFGAKLEEHISLPDSVQLLLGHATIRGYSVFLLGATKEINAKALENVRRQYPGISSIQGINGYYGEQEEQDVFEAIRKADPDIILIGISSPKKERIASRLRTYLQRGVIVPCGGVIDILGGKARREPEFIRRSGMTWLYRFAQEPRRLFRPLLVNGLRFMFVLFPIVIWKRLITRDGSFSFIRPPR